MIVQQNLWIYRLLMLNDRQLRIDTLRGLACILLVAYHVIGSDQHSGLKIADGLYRNINDILAYLRMPLFTFLSGVVYAYRPFQTDTKTFLLKKARRLLLPMLTVGTIFLLLQYFTAPGEPVVENWYLVHIIPVAHYWFLESLFLIFILVACLEKNQLLDSYKPWAVVLFMASVAYSFPIYGRYFSFSGFLYLAPFFFAGMGIERYGLMKKPSKSLAWIALFLVFGLFTLICVNILPKFGQRTLPTLLIGLAACTALLALGLKSRLLANIGVFSYSIYLFHVFFTAFSRLVFNKIDSVPVELVFIVSLLAGLLGPIVTERILNQSDWLRVLLLGKTRRKPAGKQLDATAHTNTA